MWGSRTPRSSGRPHHGRVLIPGSVRDRIDRILAEATTPLTSAELAEQAGTTAPQAARALRRLEDDGHAVRHLSTCPTGGCYRWAAVRP